MQPSKQYVRIIISWYAVDTQFGPHELFVTLSLDIAATRSIAHGRLQLKHPPKK